MSHSRSAAKVRERTRIGLGIVSLAVALSALSDLIFLRWRHPAVHAVQLTQLAVIVALYVAIRRVPRDRVRWVALLAAGALCITAAAAGIATDDDATTPLLLIALTTGTASLLPWGTAPQIATAILAAAAIVGNIYVVRGGLDLNATYPTLVVAGMALAASVYIANRLASARRITQQNVQRRRDAELALRAAYAELEQRVAERTAELQVANAALEQQMAERKEIEEAARQHQTQLAQATRLSSVGQMAAELAHELNQPLAAIANYAKGCVRHLQSNTGTTPELIGAVEEIATQAMRAGDIIRRATTLARQPATAPERTDVNDLVRDVVRFMHTETQRLGIAVRLDLAPQLAPVQIDRLQIEQVVVNLMRNGCEAMDNGSAAHELSISTAMPSLSAVEIAVRDTGRGLVSEIAARIFEPFFTTKPSGLGLGLSISRTIVEAHGGALRATSDAGGGTTFRFTLPATLSAM